LIVILFSHSYRLPQQILQLVLIRLDHLPHEHEVVTKKEYEKAQYSTLEQDQLIRFEEEEL